MARRIVVLDPSRELAALAEAFESALRGDGEVSVVRDAAELSARIDDADLVLVNRALGDGARDGLEVLRDLRARDPLLPIVIVAAEGGIEPAREAMKAGASDFLVRSARLSERADTQLRKVKKWIRLVDENRALTRENEELRRAMDARYRIVGRSPQVHDVLRRVRRVAEVPRPALILGERGTGKELVARAIHHQSGLSGPFVVVNCAAIAETLLDGELFGHERGAYTGADRQAPGKFEVAEGGTLFLDEIGHMSRAFQQKILRVVEYGTFLRVGGTREVEVRTRILAATNADLHAKIERGEFLPDLHDRLAFEELRVPPLREREGDVALLADHFLQRFMREVPTFRGKTLSARALAQLERYPFPGNVRELKNIIERAVYRDTTAVLTPEDLGLNEPARARPASGTFKERIEAFERELIEGALEEAGGNQAEAARRLGLSYHQFRYYRAKHER